MNIDFAAVPKFFLGINWRTTAGAIIPILTALTIVATAISKGELPSTDQLYVVGGAISLAWTAIFAKDKNVTGGQISNVTGETAVKPISLVDMTPTTTPK